MLYFDTSVLVPLFIRERSTYGIMRLVDELPPGAATTSEWARVEFSSLLARDVRMKVLKGQDARRVEERFDSIMSRAFNVITPEQQDFLTARQYLQRYETALRAGDALHLAIASNKNAKTIFSLDKGMARAGRLLHLPVRDDFDYP